MRVNITYVMGTLRYPTSIYTVAFIINEQQYNKYELFDISA